MQYSYILGPFYLCLLFFICVVIVVGVKVTLLIIKEKLKPKPIKATPAETPRKKPSSTRKPKSVLEINADDVDKIYFRKSS